MDGSGNCTSEFVINNLAADQREFLMKKDIRSEISRSAGVHVSIRGRYVKPKSDGSLICENDTRPLHLLITGRTRHSLGLAMKKIQELLRVPTWDELSDEEEVELIMPEEKITVGIDIWPSAFGMKSKILGENYENINYIKKETGATISLRGKGLGLSGNGDAEEPLHVLVQYGDLKMKEKARELVFNLIDTVRKEFLERFAKYYQPPKKPEIIAVRHVPRPRKRNPPPENDKSYSDSKRAKIIPSHKPSRSPTPPRRISPPLRRISTPPRRISPPPRRISPPPRRISTSPRKISTPPRRTATPPKPEESRNFVGKKDIDKITIGLDSVPPDFNLKGKIYGPALMNVKHIEKTTSALLLLQGRGCGGSDKPESDVAPYLLVKYQKPELKDEARSLIFNLIETVQQEYITVYGAYLPKPKKPQIVAFDASLIEKKPSQSATSSSIKPSFSNPPPSHLESPNKSLNQSSYSKRPSEPNSSSQSGLPLSANNRSSNSIIVPPPPPVISKPLPPIIPKPILYAFDEKPSAVSPIVNKANTVPSLSNRETNSTTTMFSNLASSNRQSLPESVPSAIPSVTGIGSQSSTYGFTSETSFPSQKPHLLAQPVPSVPVLKNRNLQYLKKKSPSPELPVESPYPECNNFCNPPFSNPSNTSLMGNLSVQREQSVHKKNVMTTRCLVPLTPCKAPTQSTPSTKTTTTISLNGNKPVISSRFEWKPPPHLNTGSDTLKNGTEPESSFFKYYDSAISDSDDNKSIICIDSEEEFGDYEILSGPLGSNPRMRSIAVQTDDDTWLKNKKIECTCGRFTHFLTGVRSMSVQTDTYTRNPH